LATGVRKNNIAQVRKKNDVSFTVSSLQQSDVATEPMLAEGKK
jgi:hypothetical protein